jgi:hypothetical protein
MSTVPPPPPPYPGNDQGPGANILDSRLSDVARSVPDPGSDLKLPAMRMRDWAKLTSLDEIAAVIAAQAFGETRLAREANDAPGRVSARQRLLEDGYNKLFATLAPVCTTDKEGQEVEEACNLAAAVKATRKLLQSERRERERKGGEFRRDLDVVLEDSSRMFVTLRDHFLGPKLKSKQDLRTSWFGIRDQRGTSGCVGWAVADLLWRQREERLDVPSARFLWQAAKELDGDERPTTMIAGAGTSIRAALSVAREHGYALEAEIPSESNELYRGSVNEFHSRLRPRRIKNFVNLGNDAKLRLAWLSLGRPIVCSFSAGLNFITSTGPDAVVSGEASDSQDLFGHALLIVGYRVGSYNKKGEWEPQGDLRSLTEAIEERDLKAIEERRRGEEQLAALEEGSKKKEELAQELAAVAEKRKLSKRYEDFPVQYLLRNSAGPGWGDRGYAWMNHLDFHRQVRESFGVFWSGKDFDALGLKKVVTATAEASDSPVQSAR